MKARVKKSYADKAVEIYRTESQDDVGLLANSLVEKWGLIAAMPAGEDSAGRAKLRLPTSKELVIRAFDIAEEFFAESKRRGHTFDIPDLEEINADKLDDK